MVFWVILVLVLLIAFQMFEMGKTPEYRISYSEFLTQVDEGNIKRIVFKGLEVSGVHLGGWLAGERARQRANGITHPQDHSLGPLVHRGSGVVERVHGEIPEDVEIGPEIGALQNGFQDGRKVL